MAPALFCIGFGLIAFLGGTSRESELAGIGFGGFGILSIALEVMARMGGV